MRALLLNLFLIAGFIAAAQNNKATLKGILIDSLHQQQVSGATVSLVKASDSSLVAFARTEADGSFSFDKLSAGKYRVSASQVNFHPLWVEVQVKVGETLVDMGQVYMKDKSLMQEVTVKNQRPPVVVNGDTLEFNAENFATKPNAVVEDMLKKMPGVEVDKDGNIRVNGKRINRVLVNGKDFFNGDPKMATKNLPADALDKVQVFEKPSDQAAFTGVDDGNSQTTINLKLKKDKNNAIFGKAGLAAGTDGRYDGQVNLNRFNGDQQVSFLGMANNTNRQGFSIMDMLNFTGQSKKMMSGGGGRITINDGNDNFGLPVDGINNSQGINKTVAGGLNYNDMWSKRTEVNASYFYNNLTLDNEQNTDRRNIVPGNNFTYLQNSNSVNRSQSNRFNFSVDHKIDSFNSIKLTSLLGYQKGTNNSQSQSNSFIPGDKTLNEGFTNTANSTEGYNTNNTLLYRHKFPKKGRTLSATGTFQYNDSRARGLQNSIYNYYTNGTISERDTLDQQTRIGSVTQSYGLNVSYTEPLSKRSLVEFRGFYNSNSGKLNRTTYDYDVLSGKHDQMNQQLSSAFENRYNYTGGGASLRSMQKKYNYSIGANMQYAELKSQLRDSAFRVRQNFVNVLPLANFTYNFSRMKSLRLEYNASTNQPTVSQLQPVKNVNDPLNITQGNPSLLQEYSHNVSLQFFAANPSRQQNWIAFLNYTATRNAIVKSDVFSGGSKTTTPVNANGVYNINGNIDRGFRIKSLNTRVGLGAFVNYGRSINFINGDKNKTGNLSMAPRLTLNYGYKQILDLNAEARLSYNKASYSLQPQLDNEYWRQSYELTANLNLPAGFSISNEVSYNVYSGRSAGYNTNVVLWNASISKQILKSKKGEIKLSAFDLLNENIGVDRNGNSNYVEDVQYKTLKRYFTLGFTYSLQKPVTGGPRATIRRF